MRILITAGGTSEAIDQVRSITNHSSGQLGVALAKAALAQRTTQIDYLIAKGAVMPPQDPRIRLHPIENTAQLGATMSELLDSYTYDAVIHAMAVSDFTPAISSSQENFLAGLNRWLTAHPDTAIDGPAFNDILADIATYTVAETKLSSKTEHLVLVLKQTEKIIGMIKRKQPQTLLIGFKLLVAVSESELLQVAHENLIKNHADYVLANDLTAIAEGRHHGYLIDSTKIVGEADTKAEIAQLILDTVAKKVRQA